MPEPTPHEPQDSAVHGPGEEPGSPALQGATAPDRRDVADRTLLEVGLVVLGLSALVGAIAGRTSGLATGARVLAGLVLVGAVVSGLRQRRPWLAGAGTAALALTVALQLAAT